MANPGNQHDQQGGGDQDQQSRDPGLAAYAHSADQSMGYLETEQQGQTEDYGDEPYGAFEHGGAMNADSDRYTPTYSADQTRLPDETGQPGAGPWATQPPGSQPLGASEQVTDAEYAAWNPPAVSGHGASANRGQPAADEPQARDQSQTAEQGQARPSRGEPAPRGGNTAAEQVLQRDTQEMEQQENVGAGAGVGRQSSGRMQPAGTVQSTDKHAEAMLNARTRIEDAIDQLASQIPYGEEFAQAAKEAVASALDYMEAQALGREAELQRDLGATP